MYFMNEVLCLPGLCAMHPVSFVSLPLSVVCCIGEVC